MNNTTQPAIITTIGHADKWKSIEVIVREYRELRKMTTSTDTEFPDQIGIQLTLWDH